MVSAAIVFFWAIGVGQTVAKDPPASIAGRVTVSGQGAPDIVVIASSADIYDKKVLGRATTDQDGNYRITGLPSGRLTIGPAARAYVKTSTNLPTGQGGQSLNISAGEAITDINFALVRGGVITGRITDADGSPLIRESVNVMPVNPQVSGTVTAIFSGSRNSTDDRGIYRIYGLAPGSYKVSVGQAKPESPSGIYRGGSPYVQTFYPGVAEEAKAMVIELKAGSEVKDVDIRTTKGARGFSVSGRVVDATTNQPAANIYVGYSPVDDANPGMGSMSFSPAATDANGKFTIEGLQPGRYIASSIAVGLENNSYSEPAKFEITDGDVSGVEIKLSRGATITGVAVIENNQDLAMAAILQTVSLYAFGDRKTAGFSFARTAIKSDGGFKFTGLGPGKIRITMMGFPAPPKGLKLSRVEVAGVEQRNGVEVTGGAEINDVRLVFVYGSGSLRGTIKVAGGTLEGITVIVMLNATPADTTSFRQGIEVDSRGRFVAEDVPPGTYDLTLNATKNQRDLPAITPIKRTVTITNGAATEINLEVDLSARKEGFH